MPVCSMRSDMRPQKYHETAPSYYSVLHATGKEAPPVASDGGSLTNRRGRFAPPAAQGDFGLALRKRLFRRNGFRK